MNIALLVWNWNTDKGRAVANRISRELTKAGHCVWSTNPSAYPSLPAPSHLKWHRLIVLTDRRHRYLASIDEASRMLFPEMRLSIGRVTPPGFHEARDLKNLLGLK